MVDGKMRLGGFFDRLRGITATYQICKKMGVDVKINFIYPFELKEVLVPNKVNWILRILCKGQKTHMDCTDIRDFNILKIAILDFFLIANAKKII